MGFSSHVTTPYERRQIGRIVLSIGEGKPATSIRSGGYSQCNWCGKTCKNRRAFECIGAERRARTDEVSSAQVQKDVEEQTSS